MLFMNTGKFKIQSYPRPEIRYTLPTTTYGRGISPCFTLDRLYAFVEERDTDLLVPVLSSPTYISDTLSPDPCFAIISSGKGPGTYLVQASSNQRKKRIRVRRAGFLAF